MQENAVRGEYVSLLGETYFEIENSQLMPEFFMSIVGSDDHWMFVSSAGALSTGRSNPDGAIFPYLADDQISAMRTHTGPTTHLRMEAGPFSGQTWSPFVDNPGVCLAAERSVYKSPMGNKVVFEERHPEWELTFRYRWTFSPKYGFVRDCWLINHGNAAVRLSMVDGLQNLLPPGVGSDFWMRYSNLGNAYKKSELIEGTPLGVFYLSSIPTDRAEPSEGLRSTVVWHTGFTPDTILLSSSQVDGFLCGRPLVPENTVRGRAGAFLVNRTMTLAADSTDHWRHVAEVSLDQADVTDLAAWLSSDVDVSAAVDADIQAGEQKLRRLIASSDGLQCGSNLNRIHRHFSNTLFNVMRGGIPLRNYDVDARDFRSHVALSNKRLADQHAPVLEALPETVSHDGLRAILRSGNDPDLTRLALEYLPLAFSRRHGDPTRPWNRFSIDLRNPDGSSKIYYQGNWRDIFQNWEALGMAFPAFLPAMICRFVNATTADGYNAYRIMKDGLEWEEPNPEDPWSNIGYWCDHQIIYLLKLLEWNTRFHPKASRELLQQDVFVHAEVPYRIRGYDAIKANPRDTIDFDWDLSQRIEERVQSIGADGKLLHTQQGTLHHVTLIEKILTLSLAKLSNFVPDGGVWLNTQRPEWNDANNALVGNGLSMVTTCYLHRWFAFLETWIGQDSSPSYSVSHEVSDFMQSIQGIVTSHQSDLQSGFSDRARAAMVDALSRSGAAYRETLYTAGPSGHVEKLSRETLVTFFADARALMEGTIRRNMRDDGLFHAYNLLQWTTDGLSVETLQEMLEGQVAVLSSGLLSAEEAVRLLDALRNSALYRADQHSYLLYPDRRLPSFLTKNRLQEKQVGENPLLSRLLADGNTEIVKRDSQNGIHFNGQFRNAADLERTLSSLPDPYRALVHEHGSSAAQLFESVFDHRKFTGRSGTFFAYEGLGSIYWHMVSKLGLAVSEIASKAVDEGEPDAIVQQLKEHLVAIREGIGAEKSPADYGAFPSDPYSHTPEKAGVKQPGMTGQVKEDVLARYMEVGVDIRDGQLVFRIDGFDPSECVKEDTVFTCFDLDGAVQTIPVPAGGFGFTVCGVPVVHAAGDSDCVVLHHADTSRTEVDGHTLDVDSSQSIFARTGRIQRMECFWKALTTS